MDLHSPTSSTPPSTQRTARRRLVQSTLFSPKPPDSQSPVGLKPEQEESNEDTASQGTNKKKRARKGNTINSTPPSAKAAKKSKKRTPASSTPKKNSKSEVTLVENGALLSPIPNLRLEEKLIAEENNRRFSGRQIHPFFSSRKTNKRCQETAEVDNSCGLVKRKDKGIGPIHVFERDQGDDVSLDWKNWKFFEKSHTSNGYDLERPLSLSCESSVDSLCFKKFTGSLDPIGSSLVQDGTSSDEHLYQQALLNNASTTVSAMSSDSKKANCTLADNGGMECEVDEVTFLSSGVTKSDTEQEIEFLQERSLSGYLCCTSQLENRLWTDKHRPEKAVEVCGNDESVKFMSEWLRNWYESGHHARKDFSRVASLMEDSDTDYDCSGSDYDSETMEKETALKSILLVSGPAGSGKSAAINACAKEQGFEVFEVNASECRNGAIVKQRFGEMLECRTLTRSLENNAQSQRKIIIKSSIAKMTTKLDNELVQVIPLIDDDDDDDYQGDARSSRNIFCENNSNTCKGVKPLILFEDVDIIFQEDHGLLAAIKQIAEKAKVPVILTSTNYNPELPANLNRTEVCFTMPSQEELLRVVRAVCSAEKNSVEPPFIDQLIKYCHGDIRKTIMHLQFWCQGRHFRKGLETERLFRPLQFDAEVGHWMLPKMIPWDIPSQLSQLIEKEITMALAKMNENNLTMEVTGEDFDMTPPNDFEIHTFEESNIAAKKKAMLSRNCSDHDCNGSTVYFDDDCDLLDSNGTHVSGFPRNSRRKPNVVMSSDSDDEIHNPEFPFVKQTNGNFFLEVCGAFAATSPIKNCFRPSVDQQICVKAENLVENHVQWSEAANDLDAQDTCQSIDVSCVPESSFVPETEVNETEVSFSRLSCCPVADTLGDVSVNYDFRELPPVGADSLDEFQTETHKDFKILETCALAGLPPEEVEDSLNLNIESVRKEYQLMDECSRMDFNGKLKPIVKLSSCTMKNFVQELWKELRERRTDLRQYVISEKDASGLIKLAHHLSNLISEADLLIAQNRPLDSVEIPATPEASDVSSWCDEHLQIVSTIASHGFDLYAKKIADEGLRKGSESVVDFTCKEVLATSKEVNGFARQGFDSMSSQDEPCMRMCQPVSGTFGNRDSFLPMIQSIIPLRSHTTLRGDAFYEYLSSLGHISRSEDSRLSEGTDKRKGKRGRRATRHYLNNGSLAFSIDDIALLSKSNIYGQI